MVFLDRWLWPVYAFIVPWIFWWGATTSLNEIIGATYQLQARFLMGFLLVGIVLEIASNPGARLRDVVHLPRFFRNHPAVFVALLFGTWAVVSALFSPSPAVALLGSLYGTGEGAFWAMGLSLVFMLVYLRSLRDPAFADRLLKTVILSGTLLAAVAVIEVVRGKSFYPQGISVPIVSFLGPGHLSGMLIMVLGVALGYWYRGNLSALWSGLLLAFSIGLGNRRAVLLGVVVALLAGVRSTRRFLVAAVVVLLALTLGFQSATWRAQASEGEIRNYSDPRTLVTRLQMWKSALGGMEARPVFGWGAGQFDEVWPQFLSRADLALFMREEYGIKRVLSVGYQQGGPPVFMVESAEGTTGPFLLSPWKSHNHFLELGLLRGGVGLAIYLVLLGFVIWGAWLGSPAAIGVLAYQAFLLLWFVPTQADVTMWMLMSVGCVATVAARARPKLQPAVSSESAQPA